MSNQTVNEMLIWKVLDPLKGFFPTSEYINVIIPFIVLRRLDFVSELQKSDMSHLISDSNNIENNWRKYLDVQDINILELLDNLDLERNIKILIQNGHLIHFIKQFSQIDLSLDKVSNHQIDMIFEHLLFLNSRSGFGGGESYTPRDVVKLMVSLIFSDDTNNLQSKSDLEIKVYDPCFGTGGFLKMSKQYIHQHNNDKIKLNFTGQEINQLTNQYNQFPN